MGDVFQYLEFRAQGRTKENKFRKSWKAVLHMLEDVAAIPSHNQPCKFPTEARATFLMDFSPSMLRVASTHGDHTVRVSDVRTGKCIKVLAGHPRTPWCLAFSPTSDDVLASGCLAGEIRIWDLLGDGREVLRNPCHGQVVTSLAFHPGGHVLAFSSMNYIYFWDWRKETPSAFTQTSHQSERIRWLKFDPFGHYLYTGIGNLTDFKMDIVDADFEVRIHEDDDDDDYARHIEAMRHQQRLNSARLNHRLLERFMAVGQDGFRNQNRQVDFTRNLNRVSQSTNRTRTDARLGHDQSLQPGHTCLNQSSGRSQAVGSEAYVGNSNRSERRNLDSLSLLGRHGEEQPRQRWGRYEPSFFTRPSSSRDSNNSFSFNNNIHSNSSYQPSISNNAASRNFDQLTGSRQSEHGLYPCRMATLFPQENQPSGSSRASLIAQASSRQLRSKNVGSECLDANEFRILPVDQGNEEHRKSTHKTIPSFSLESDRSDDHPSFLQQQNNLRSLLNRYTNRSNAMSSASSGTTMPNTAVPSLISQSSMSSAETNTDNVETRSSVTLLADSSQAKSLTALEAEGKLLCTADSNFTHSSALHTADNEGSCEIPPLNTVSTSIPTSEHVTQGRKDAPTSADVLEESHSFGSSINNNPFTRQYDIIEWLNSHEGNTFTEHQDTTSEMPEYNSQSCSQAVTDNKGRPEEGNQHHKYEAVPSTSSSTQSGAGIGFYDVASKEVSTNALNSDKCQGGASKITASYSSSLQNVSETRHTNTMPSNFETTFTEAARSECSMRSSRFDVIPRPESRKHNLLRRSRHLATSSWVNTLPDSENTNIQPDEAAFMRTHRPEYYNPRLRCETAAARTHSVATHGSIHAPFNQSQALRNIRMAYSSRPWGHNERLEHRHPLSFHDRQISRPVTDQASQTLGAMKLPASSDQGTDVVGLNETPVNRLQRGNIVDSSLNSFISGSDCNVTTDQSSSSSFSAICNRTNINPSFPAGSGNDGSAEEMDIVLETERLRRITVILQTYLEVVCGVTVTSPPDRVNSMNPESRNADTAGTQVNRTSGFTDGAEHLRNVNSECANQHSFNADRIAESQRNKSVGYASRNTAANSRNPAISLPVTIGSATSTESNTTISSAIRPFPNTSAFGIPEQVHSAPSISSSATSGRSASRAIQLFSRRDSDAPESDQLHTDGLSLSSTSFASNLVHRPLLSNTRYEPSARFHPYASSLHRGRNPVLHRQPHTSRDLMNNDSTVSDRITMGMCVTPGEPRDTNSSDNNNLSSLRNQPQAANVTTRLQDSDQHSAFSVFSTSNRETATHQCKMRMSTSDRDPSSSVSASFSSSNQPHSEVPTEASSQSSIQSLRTLQDSGQDCISKSERQITHLKEPIESLGGMQQASSRNVPQRTPDPYLEYQAAAAEYLERRVTELDDRLYHLEQSLNFQLHELQQEYLSHGWRSRRQIPTILRGVNPTDSMLFPRAETSTSARSSDSTPPVMFSQLRECLRMHNPNPTPRVLESDLPTSVTISQDRDSVTQGRRQPWYGLRQIHLHPDYSERSTIGDTSRNSVDEMRLPIAGYNLGITSNSATQTYRIQQWDISKVAVPTISDASANIVVRHCRLHNDASCNLSQDGTLLVTIVPGLHGQSDIIALFSLRKQSFAQCLYTKSVVSNAISVSISPLNRYVLVGLASRRMMLVTSAQVVGHVYKLVKEKAGERSMIHHNDIYHIHDEERGHNVSVNSARWLPRVGEGLVYGTNRGDLHFFRAGSRKIYDREEFREAYTACRRRISTRSSIATQTTTVSIRRSASTQTTSPCDDSVREERMITEGERSSADRSES